ncbi:MAG: agmatine deiminase family protein [Planctomycetota bacterium]
MRRLWICAGVVLFVWLHGLAALASPPGVLDRSNAESEDAPLPKYMTEAEKLLPPLAVPRDDRAPPTGSVYCPPEYDPMEGLFFAWEGYTSLITAMVVPMTNNDPPATAFVVVDTSSEQSSVYSSLSSSGADMDHVEFIVRATNTVWIRDYGPRFIFEDANRAIIDHTYNRPRPSDNSLNDYVASLWGEPQYDIPLTHGGGNFHLFSNGDAFMTDLILDENPGLSEQDVKDYYADYQNLDLTIYPGFPTSFDSTQHIDMWMLPVGDNKIIIGEYSSSTGQPYAITENAVTNLTSRGYTVYRTPGWNSGGTHYTYTNAVIVNDIVFVPKFNVGGDDATALAVFQSAMPDHTFIQVDCSSIIYAAGAIHCIVMHVPATCALMGDMNGDGARDGNDIQAYLSCKIDGGPDCACAGITIDAFVSGLLD